MVLREQKKLEKGKELTRDEKSNLRRKKLKQVRAGTGAVGRPKQATKGGKMSRQEINMAREMEMMRVSQGLEGMGANVSLAQSKGVFRLDEKPDQLTGVGEADYITQPNQVYEMDGQIVVAPNFPYKTRFQ